MKYKNPDMEIMVLDNEDIIKTSGDLTENEFGGGTDSDIIDAGNL